MFGKRRDHISKAIASSSVHGPSLTESLIRSEFWPEGDTTAIAYLRDALEDANRIVEDCRRALRIEEMMHRRKEAQWASDDEVHPTGPEEGSGLLVNPDDLSDPD